MKEKAGTDEVLCRENMFKALAVDHPGDAFVGQPQFLLALGDDHAGQDRVDPDVLRTQSASHAFGQADNAGFGSRVDRHVGHVEHEGDRREINNRATATSPHQRRDGL